MLYSGSIFTKCLIINILPKYVFAPLVISEDHDTKTAPKVAGIHNDNAFPASDLSEFEIVRIKMFPNASYRNPMVMT